MLNAVRRGTLPLIALSVGALSVSGASVDRGPESGRLPRLILWVWERPTDLRALDADIGVAFLSQTVRVRNEAFAVMPRRNPLRVSPHTPLVAVTRIESDAAGASALPPPVVFAMAAAIAGTADLPRVSAVQIDFDAAESERVFYRTLIGRVRNALDARVPLSITALASWCAQDHWMGGLPVDEAVPMLFRLGPLNAPYTGLARSVAAATSECRGAVGTSLDEPIRIRAGGRRVYVFNASAWTPDSVALARELVE